MIKNQKKNSYFQSQCAGINNLQSYYTNKITDLHNYFETTVPALINDCNNKSELQIKLVVFVALFRL